MGEENGGKAWPRDLVVQALAVVEGMAESIGDRDKSELLFTAGEIMREQAGLGLDDLEQ